MSPLDEPFGWVLVIGGLLVLILVPLAIIVTESIKAEWAKTQRDLDQMFGPENKEK